MARMPWWVALAAAGCGSAVMQPDEVDVPRSTVRLAAQTTGREFTSIGPVTLFVGSDIAAGAELWRTDGTPEGTRLVEDIEPGLATSSPHALSRHGDLVFFDASTTEHGNELWRSDGTAQGTHLVRDIHPGPGASFPVGGHSFPHAMISAGSFLAFVACDPEHGPELWRTDGTAGATRLVADVYPGPGERVDGAGPCLENRGPHDLVVMGGLVYFLAEHPASGTELWRSDGTAPGTWMVTEVYPGPDPPPVMRSSGVPVANLVAAESRLFFYGPGGLWTSDGTAEGTRLLGPFGGLLTASRTRAFGGGPDGFWVADASAAPPRRIHPVTMATSIRFENRVSRFTAIGDQVFFDGQLDGAGYEAWRSDGTPEGTFQLADINPGRGDSDPRDFIEVGDHVYFTASGDALRGLFTARPSVPGVTAVTDSRWGGIDAIGTVGRMLLLSTGTGLWSYQP